MSIRVVVADDHDLVRVGIVRMLADIPGIEVGKDEHVDATREPLLAGTEDARRAAFFGREKEMERVLGAIGPQERGWGAVIDGIGGIGKSTLALVCPECQAKYEVDLADLGGS